MSRIDPQETILVTGATGNVGRHVVSQLLGKGASVRALTRSPESARLPREAVVVRGDVLSIAEHMEGVEAVFLVWREPTADAGKQVIDAIANQARRVVFLSSSAIRDDLDPKPNFIGQLHADIEKMIEQSGLQWTFLRPGGFATNSRWWMPQILQGDVVRWPYGNAAWSPIHERDIASVAVRSLTEPGHHGAKYFLTGPQSLTQAEQVRTIGDAIGRPLRFEEISPEEGRPLILAYMPVPVVDLLLEAWGKMVLESESVTSAVPDITGSPARTFREWANDHSGEFQASSNRLPDLDRPDAGAILVSEWKVGTTERQQATIAAFAKAWQHATWPKGLLSVNLLESTSGDTVLNYAQWTSDEEYREFVRTQRKSIADEIDRAVPGIERSAPVRYRVYRSTGSNDAQRAPGCIVIASIEFDGPDEERQKALVDTVFDALESETAMPSGGISGHFHLSTDGTRVLNYAEWTDEDSHHRAIDASGQGTIGSGSKWQQVLNFPGVVSNRFARYCFRQSILPQPTSAGGGKMTPTSNDRLRIAIIIGSTRQGRFAPTVANWFADQARTRDDMDVDAIDLADAHLPDVLGVPPGPEVSAISQRLADADGFVVVTPEYNHSFPAPLKTAIDWHSKEWQTKPVGFVSYGGLAGGLRAVEQLRQVFAELHAVTVRDTVSFHGVWSQFNAEGRPSDPARYEKIAQVMLNQLAWWAQALREARSKRPYGR